MVRYVDDTRNSSMMGIDFNGIFCVHSSSMLEYKLIEVGPYGVYSCFLLGTLSCSSFDSS
jgi:hypothetical protein